MTRWLIWSQVGFAVIGLVASLADQGRLPRHLCPPQFVLLACYVSVILLPALVLRAGGQGKAAGRIVEGVVTIGLALATFFALLPLVQ
ncbi:hypothetical protein [Paludisphaera rhizosphaerae]|uniref:hypothetical protein n=1 Tax=Paludisphaera rhizosphaerae TaxID=2711216 RepID=UPI0013EB2677|nr:hypothetical protein [Paludisphaera rhizosphaerae]